MKKAARDKVAENQKSVFHDKEKFKYADDEETLRKLMGLWRNLMPSFLGWTPYAEMDSDIDSALTKTRH